MNDLIITVCKHGVNLAERDCRMCFGNDRESDLMDEIERLTAENERLRDALEEIVDDYKTPMNRDAVKAFGLVKYKARQALKGDKP